MREKLEVEPLVTPKEAGALLGVNPRTVTRYAQAGRLRAYRTAGQHRRFKLADVIALRDRGAEDPHKPFPHNGVVVCGACSRATGEPVTWESCGAK